MSDAMSAGGESEEEVEDTYETDEEDPEGARSTP